MKKTSKILLILYLFVFFSSLGRSQTIRLIRTDVDSLRSGFVTASYLFGVDVKVEGVQKCNGVSFQLSYNTGDYIRYSEWQTTDFGKGGKTVVIPQIDTLGGSGIINVMVLSGEIIDTAIINDPVVIHLDFSVSQAAEHGLKADFTFNTAHAVANVDSTGTVINLNSSVTTYNIHGFVDVWPGDSDNNGIVNQNDMDRIAIFLGYGSETKQMRSFKRPNASTLWTAQRVLAWDIAEATYADCDGNSEVTSSDLLVVQSNYNKQHSSIEKKKEIPQLSEFREYKPCRTESSILIPIRVSAIESYVGASARIFWDELEPGCKVIGFDKGEIFTNEESYIYGIIPNNENYCDIALGTFDYSKKVNGSGILGYLVVEANEEFCGQMIKPRIEQLTGLSPLGYTFPLDFLSTVDDNSQKSNNIVNIIQFGENIKFEFAQELYGVYKINIYNSQGNQVVSSMKINTSINKIKNINIRNLPTGAYYSVISGINSIYAKPFFILR